MSIPSATPDPDPEQTPEVRAAALRRRIEAANHAYYILDSPSMADAEYDRLMQALLAAGLVQDPGDLYSLTREQLVGLERIADKSAQNILDNIQASQSRLLGRTLFGLGIRHVGERLAQALATAFGPIQALGVDPAELAAPEELAEFQRKAAA